MLYPLQQAAPQANLIEANRMAFCKYMKMITLPKLRDSLRDMKFEVKVAAGDRRARPDPDRAHGRDRLASLRRRFSAQGCSIGPMRRARLAVLGALVVSLLIPAGAAAQSKGDVQPKVVGGHAASITQYPWQAAVFVDGEQICGGSLLTSRIVITAAHCVFDTTPTAL